MVIVKDTVYVPAVAKVNEGFCKVEFKFTGPVIAQANVWLGHPVLVAYVLGIHDDKSVNLTELFKQTAVALAAKSTVGAPGGTSLLLPLTAKNLPLLAKSLKKDLARVFCPSVNLSVVLQ